MSSNLTFRQYARILDTVIAKGLRTLTVCEYITSPPYDQFAVFRHDVDYSPKNAVRMAQLEAERNIAATYYFHAKHRPQLYDLSAMREIKSLGHEIGLHYETLDLCDGDAEAALKLFRSQVDILRSEGFDVRTVCAHGNPRKKKVGYNSNFEMFQGGVEDVQAEGLVGEAYLSCDFSDFTYLSDVGGRLPALGGSTGSAIEHLEEGATTRLYMLTHPGYWSNSRIRAMAVSWAGSLIRASRLNKIVQKFRSTSVMGNQKKI